MELLKNKKQYINVMCIKTLIEKIVHINYVKAKAKDIYCISQSIHNKVMCIN